eukprot:NODE_8860_length_1464_cov_5.763650.p1 GENE.NODE_8860_length_1464_cov_5.763650~~NODE_8860_length_1464_cov_5.763650.p1  ORF type:complete len:317 (-),score=52.23 NODE_8860_length_1464_cov_5.763650:378-1328(-)
MEEWLLQCCRLFEVVLIVLGNHEYYCHSRKRRVADNEIFSIARRVCKSVSTRAGPSGGHAEGLPERCLLLENEAVTLGGVCVAGTTLWSAIHPVQTVQGAIAAGQDPLATVEFRMNDFRCVYVQGPHPGCEPQNLECARVNEWHATAVEFLEREARQCSASHVPMIILTHHAPSFQTSSDEHIECARSDGFGCAFHTALDDMMWGRLPALHTWAFGHTHHNVDLNIGQVRVVSNQRGYKDSKADDYRLDCVLQVPAEWPLLEAEVELALAFTRSKLVSACNSYMSRLTSNFDAFVIREPKSDGEVVERADQGRCVV